MRAIASRGLLAWTVVIEPSCPVFIACNMSSASSPRTSPTTMRSGRIRRALITSSRCRTAPLPSTLGGRHSSRTTCSCFSRSSAESSMVTMRSRSEMNPESTLSKVVLPAPVPPETTMFSRAFTAYFSTSSICGVSARLAMQVLCRERRSTEAADGEQRAIDGQRRNDDVHARAIRQARIHHGRRFVDPPAYRGDNLVDDVHQVGIVFEGHVGRSSTPARST